jgi:hypothetical protein
VARSDHLEIEGLDPLEVLLDGRPNGIMISAK